jgi:hypothetical protein
LFELAMLYGAKPNDVSDLEIVRGIRKDHLRPIIPQEPLEALLMGSIAAQKPVRP